MTAAHLQKVDGGAPRAGRHGVVVLLAFALALLAADVHPLTHGAGDVDSCVACQVAEQPVSGSGIASAVATPSPLLRTAPLPHARTAPEGPALALHAARAPPLAARSSS